MNDRRSRHVWEFVETLLGPIIYLGFFGLTYLSGSLVCALSRGNVPAIEDAQTAVGIAVLGLALIALLLLAWHMAKGIRLLARGREDGEELFMGLVTLTLALLSALAVLWTAVPAATVAPTC